MNIFRRLLKNILSILAKRAIHKHNIELIVVTGFYGTEIVREGIYEILNQKYKVRRNTDQILWDMSIPLAVLGYQDKRRNVIEWIMLIFRAGFYLLFGPSNEHILVLNANCTFTETAKFWASFLEPDYLVILNYEKESAVIDTLLSKACDDKTILIYNRDSVDEKKLYNIKARKKFSFSSTKGDLKYDIKSKTLKYKEKKIKLPSIVPKVMVELFAAIFSLSVNHGFTLEKASLEALKFDLSGILIKRIKENIGKERID